MEEVILKEEEGEVLKEEKRLEEEILKEEVGKRKRPEEVEEARVEEARVEEAKEKVEEGANRREEEKEAPPL